MTKAERRVIAAAIWESRMDAELQKFWAKVYRENDNGLTPYADEFDRMMENSHEAKEERRAACAALSRSRKGRK